MLDDLSALKQLVNYRSKLEHGVMMLEARSSELHCAQPWSPGPARFLASEGPLARSARNA